MITSISEHNRQHSVLGGFLTKGQLNDNRTAVIIGDSLSNVVNLSAVRSPANSVWMAAQIVMGQKLHVLNYAGVGGDTLQQISDRYDAQVAAYNPAYVAMLLAGGNTLVASTAVSDADAAFALTKGMIDKAISAGSKFILSPAPPRIGYDSQIKIDARDKYNMLVADYARNNSDVIYIDPSAKNMLDSAAYPAWVAALTDDDTHLNSQGAFTVGKTMGDLLSPFLQAFNPFADYRLSKAGTVNPIMYGTGGTSAIGNAPDSWTADKSAALTGTAAKVARSDGLPGEWAQLTVTNSTAASEFVRYTSAAEISLADAGLEVGDVVQCFVEFEYDSAPTQLRSIEANARIVDPVGGDIDLAMNFTPSSDPAVIGDGAFGVMATVPYEIPSNATGVYITKLIAFTEAAGAAFVVRFGRSAIRKISAAVPAINQT